MRILIVHNFYQEKGGEDVVFAEETQMLQENGHDVFHFTAHNDELKHQSMAKIAVNMLWSQSAKQAIVAKIAEVKPDIVHFHNTFMSISPSAYYACQEANIPVVQTLHNYRMVCPKATLFRDGTICTKCVSSLLYTPAIQHACYRESRSQTMGVVVMLNLHTALKTWDKQVDKYICLSEHSKQIFIQGGFPAYKLSVKGNFLQYDPGYSDIDENYFVFLGRLVPEKGVRVLLEAWKQLPNIPLKILGDGKLLTEARAFIDDNHISNIELLGHIKREDALEIVKKSSAQIVPSQWHEPFGLVAIEAFACGKPVIASNVGALSDIVEDMQTGLLFSATNPTFLAEKVQWLWQRPEERKAMSAKARQTYEAKYTSSVNYQQLVAIYEEILE